MLLTEYFLVYLICMDLMGFGAIEFMQLCNNGWKDYFTDVWNYIDWSAYLLIIPVIICNNIDFKLEEIRRVACYVVLIFWIKLFYWMRLFSSTAGFIRLIAQTVSDTKAFVIMLTICILMFANGFILLDQ